MASIVLGAAGAFVGSFFGPLGSSIGWMLGSALGSALGPHENQQGPRLSDLKLQTSSYGTMIPIIFGTVRIAGTVIWQTDLVEHAEKSGGKGGPTVTNYTYSASFAIALCEGPIGGVSRIWADSRLVYSVGVNTVVDFPFTLYLGTETQLPDPTLEAREGVGNVPGHRGMAYVVFADIPLAEYGNRLPLLTFEIFSAGGAIPWRVSSFTPFAFPAGMVGAVNSDESSIVVSKYTVNGGGSGATFDYETRLYSYQGDLRSTDVQTFNNLGGYTPCVIHPCANKPALMAIVMQQAGTANVSAWYVDGLLVSSPITTAPLGSDSYNSISSMPSIYMDGYVYAISRIPGANPAYVSRWPAPGGIPVAASDATYQLTGAPAADFLISPDDNGQHIWVTSPVAGTNGGLWKLNADLTLAHHWDGASTVPSTYVGAPGGGDFLMMLASNGLLCFYARVNSIGIDCFYAVKVNPDNTFTNVGQLGPGESVSYTMSLGNGFALVNNGVISINPPAAPIQLSEIISALSMRAGLTTDQINVAQLTDWVDGYVIANQASVRSAIEPLQIAYSFDAVESDVVAKFVKRGGELDATIPAADLGAYSESGEPPSDLATERLKEVDLPRVITTIYIDKDADYQSGSQISQRLITSSQLATSVQLPIVMTATKGKQITDTLLYGAWLEREQFKFNLARKWAKLEPADVVNVKNRLMRIAQKTDGADGVAKFEAVATSAQLFLQASLPAPGVGMPPTIPPVLQPTYLLMLDLPLIGDTDQPNGHYAAMAGAWSTSWPGAMLYKSIDGGATYHDLVIGVTADTIGMCATTLGNFSGANIFDEVNTVDVVLSAGSGTLASSNMLGVLNGANAAAIGISPNIEVIQFRDATLIAAQTYRLAGLLRGRRGSEWMMGSHIANEDFILLPASINVAGPSSELSLARQYKAVTGGQHLVSATVVTFANTGVALQPYAPVHLGGGRNAAGDITLAWIRRTRIGGTWIDAAEVPLSEPSERYEVLIYATSAYATLKRIIPASTPVVVYDASLQTTDFGSLQTTLYWGVHQLGTYFFGHEARGSI